MPLVGKPLGSPLNSSAGHQTLYTTPANTRTRILEIIFCNTTGAAVTVTMSFVPSGGGAGSPNEVLDGFSIPAHGFYPIAFNTFLATGDFIDVIASGAGVNMRVSGIEIT